MAKLHFQEEIKVYKRRWIVLFFYILLAVLNAYQWFEYSIINNIVAKYYNVSSKAVDWTSIMYMVTYPLTVVPIMYYAEKRGLRVIVLIGAVVTAFGSVVKLFAMGTGSFWIILVAQFFLSCCQPITIGLVPKVVAVWFGKNEVSRACALGVMGTLIGNASGFLIPTVLVNNHEDIAEIGDDLYVLTWTAAAPMIAVAIAIVIYFPKRPPLPPSIGQLESRRRDGSKKNGEFKASIKKLVLNWGYMVHLVAYGISVGVLSTIGTFLNQYILAFFRDSIEDAGRMGILSILAGIFGSFVFGYILDKTRKFKETTTAIYIFSCISVAILLFSLKYKIKALVYIACALEGLFLNTYLNVGLEMATELTYPISETISAGLLVTTSQIFGAVMALLTGWIFGKYGPIMACSCHVIALFLGTLMTASIPNVLKRQMVLNKERFEANNDGEEIEMLSEENIKGLRIVNSINKEKKDVL